MKGRNSQVLRIYRILSILEGAPHGLSASDLAERLHERGFDIGKRTIYRDLEALKGAGFPLEEKGKSDENGTRWTLERNTKLNHYLVLNSRELMALYLARSVLSSLKQTPFYADLSTTFDKISEKLGTKAVSFMDEMSQEFHFDNGPQWGLGLKAEIIDTVRAAVTERQILSMTYSSVNSGNTTTRQVGPHYLYFAKGSLYMVAEDLQDHVVKIFSVPRITEATMLEETYSGNVTDPAKFFASSFGIFKGEQPETVRISFAPKVAAYIRERQWHPSQSINQRDNGYIEIELQVAQTPELIQWILGYGSQAMVLEPESLAQRIQEEANLVVKSYQRKIAV